MIAGLPKAAYFLDFSIQLSALNSALVQIKDWIECVSLFGGFMALELTLGGLQNGYES